MIKVEERFAAFDPPSYLPCMHDQWYGWAQDNWAAERLHEPSSNSHVWKPAFAWFQHVATSLWNTAETPALLALVA